MSPRHAVSIHDAENFELEFGFQYDLLINVLFILTQIKYKHVLNVLTQYLEKSKV